MRKQFVEPQIVKIELNLAENIAASMEEEVTSVGGIDKKVEAGLIPKCQKYFVDTKYEVMNEDNVLFIYLGGCINPGTPKEVVELRMMRP